MEADENQSGVMAAEWKEEDEKELGLVEVGRKGDE